MEESNWLAATLWLPPGIPRSGCKRFLSRWEHALMKTEHMGVAHMGGVFGPPSGTYPRRPQYHAHLVLMALDKRTGRTAADIDAVRWESDWSQLTDLPRKAAELRQGDNLQGWLDYIFIKNARQADDWFPAIYNERLLCKHNRLKEVIKGDSSWK